MSEPRLIGTGRIMGVRKEVRNERPCICLLVWPEGGDLTSVPLTREMAAELTAAWGPNEIVEEFFRNGEGLQ